MKINEVCQEMKIYNQSIFSNPSAICLEIGIILEKLGSLVNLNENEHFDVRVILSELLQNALRHGNQMDENKKIQLDVSLADGELLHISVLDEGPGFDVSQTLIQKRDRAFRSENIFEMEECGRGLMIIETLCDSVIRNDMGNWITVQKQLH